MSAPLETAVLLRRLESMDEDDLDDRELARELREAIAELFDYDDYGTALIGASGGTQVGVFVHDLKALLDIIARPMRWTYS